ncbi:MAG: P-loop containing nucleoside triphosphate hydrolase protein [Monoraphidium minutum]|nr:MAG: P-loop containing nucleoside triphosphate hydrolase protein [Monoraphidium minutum]
MAAKDGKDQDFKATQYGQKSARMIALTNQLRDAGAACVVDLPTVAVCGNQSAGKSSLLERLCGIQLPRATGTCTKCPTEVRLSDGGQPWSCLVKLRYEFDADNTRRARPDEVTFASLDEARRGDVATAIRAAQKALLNPRRPWEELAALARPGADAEALGEGRDQLKFTRNVVVLEVMGADVNLTLIDLPGIIQSDDDNPDNKHIVTSMVTDFIKESRTIVIAAVMCGRASVYGRCKDDINNQAIMDLARQVDPDGCRTLGVLTKPDTIEQGTHDQWLPVLRGEKFKLDLGYFAVRNPSQKELDGGITAEVAAQNEVAFFRDDSFWGSDHLDGLRGRFGVERLRHELSHQLVRITMEELPGMIKSVQDALDKVNKHLEEMPRAPAGDKNIELQQLCSRLHAALLSAVEAQDNNVHYAQRTNGIFQAFKADVLRARPYFRIGGAEPEAGSEGGAGGAVPGEEAEAFWLDTKPSRTAPSISLEDVKALMAEHRVRELPGFVPYTAVQVLINRHKGRWDAVIDDCCSAVAAEVEDLLMREVRAVFERFPRAHALVRSRLVEVYREVVEEMEAQLALFKATERRCTLTLNDHYFTDAREAFNGSLRRRRARARTYYAATSADLDASSCATAGAISALGEIGINGVKRDDLFKLLKDDDGAAPLLDAAAATLAYFKVASKRVIDCVPMSLDTHLSAKFAERAKTALFALVAESAAAGGGAGGGEGAGQQAAPAGAAQLLEEEAQIAERRGRLASQQATLREARRILMAF